MRRLYRARPTAPPMRVAQPAEAAGSKPAKCEFESRPACQSVSKLYSNRAKGGTMWTMRLARDAPLCTDTTHHRGGAVADSREARGLGWDHRRNRDRLLRKHRDGSPCWWCGLPMWRDAHRNWDAEPLHADHTHARSHGGKQADRLLHAQCNRQRQDGRYDDHRPAVTGIHPGQWKAAHGHTQGWQHYVQEVNVEFV